MCGNDDEETAMPEPTDVKSYLISRSDADEADIAADEELQKAIGDHGGKILKTFNFASRGPVHTVEISESKIGDIKNKIPGAKIEPNSSLQIF